MTMRLSINSLAGMARTLVAVGTSSDAFMFLTTAAAAPRNTRTSSPSPRRAAAAAFDLAGVSTGAFCSVEAALLIGRVLAGGAGLAAWAGSGAGFGSGGAAGSAGCPLPVNAAVSVAGSGE